MGAVPKNSSKSQLEGPSYSVRSRYDLRWRIGLALMGSAMLTYYLLIVAL